uniref:C-type lectin domain-containing protein n=1 Tax=Caenorhabditis japonica TaxID=281687 RepID=A0A8R1EFT3_CAEJA
RWYGGNQVGPGQPDNAVGHGPQNCLQILAISPGYWNNPGKWSAYRTGDFDDYWCNMKDPEMRLYACGMRGPRE